MKQAKVALLVLSLSCLSSHVLANESEYNVNTRILSIPSIKIGEEHVYDAALKFNDAGSFDIIGFSDQPPTSSDGNIDVECTAEHITSNKFNQIIAGMSVEQINSLIGCEGELQTASGSFSEYWWKGGTGGLITPLISIKFDNDSSYIQTYLP